MTAVLETRSAQAVVGAIRLARPWLATAVIAMMVASDYKLRRRQVDLTISGAADIFIFAEIAVYGAIAAWLLWTFYGSRSVRRLDPPLAAMWVFTGIVAVSVSYSVYPQLAMVRASQLIVIAMLTHVAATVATRRHMSQLIHAFVGLTTLSVVLGVVLPQPREELVLDRFNWLYLHPTVTSIYLGMAVVLLVGYLGRRHLPDRMWPVPAYVVLLAINGAGLLATQTRAAIAATVLACVVMVLMRNSRQHRMELVIAGLVTLPALAALFYRPVLDFLGRGETAQQIASLNGRTRLWAAAWELVQEQPLFGHGLGASRGLLFETTGRRWSLGPVQQLGGGHNALINTLLDVGIVGAVALVAVIVLLGVRAAVLRRNTATRPEAAVILAALTFLLIDGIATEHLAVPANVANIWLFMLVAWTAIVHRTSTSDEHALSTVDAEPVSTPGSGARPR